MKYSLKKIKKITKVIKTINLDKKEFDYLRISSINDKIDEKKAKNLLFFPITISKKDVQEGWYINETDLRKHINEIVEKNKNYTLVLEENMLKDINYKKTKIILVPNIMKAIDDLTKYTLKKSKAKFFCTTGSIGKTTTVNMMNEILKLKGKTLFIYSKRITPLILKSHLLNYLDKDIKYVTLETSLFYKDHIKYFAELLKPEVGILLNIEKEHLKIDKINSKKDILISKSKLLLNSKKVIINESDKEIQKLQFTKNKLYYKKELIGKHKIKKIIKINPKIKNLTYTPYLLTKLSILQAEVNKEVGKYIKLDEELIDETISNFKPDNSSSKRLEKKYLENREIIFDADVSGVCRIKKLTDHLYSNASLVIRNLTKDGEENEFDLKNTQNYKEILKTFKKFDRVYVFKQVEGYKNFKNCENVEIVTNHNFINKIKKDSKIFYHYGSYYRKYEKYDENILKKGD